MSRRTEYQTPWFNERLTNAINTSGMSIDEIARKCGLRRSSIYNWYNGVGWPSIPSLLRLEEALKLERGSLIKK